MLQEFSAIASRQRGLEAQNGGDRHEREKDTERKREAKNFLYILAAADRIGPKSDGSMVGEEIELSFFRNRLKHGVVDQSESPSKLENYCF